MSTFLTQGSAYSNSYANKNSKQTTASLQPEKSSDPIQSAMMTVPFIKPTDKVTKKDVAELSFSDFQPKRFALNYDPPMIILEYLVPSTGKLYHHKMKLNMIKPDTRTEDVIDYLKKRHPLYFIANKIQQEQISDLINRLKFKIKQLGIVTQGDDSKLKSKGSSADTQQPQSLMSKKENVPLLQQPLQLAVSRPATASTTQGSTSLLGPLPSIGSGFKSGSQLPSITTDQGKVTASSLLAFSEKNKQKQQQLFSEVKEDLAKANQDNEEDEDDYGEQYEEEEEDDEDFDANELLNLTDYQNKRRQQPTANIHSNMPLMGSNKYAQQRPETTQNTQKMGRDGAIEINNEYDDDEQEEEEEEEDDGWGDDWGAPKKKDLTNFDYENTNLNKLTQEEIAMHKKKMDEKFNKNQLKPGDPGFVYDKRIDFSKKTTGAAKADASWDEDDNVDNYFDDDFM